MFGIKTEKDKRIEELENEINNMIYENAELKAVIMCADDWKRQYDKCYRGTEKDEWDYRILTESWDRSIALLKARGYLRE